ncbi:MAG: PSD1 and planctomycete cytochrome C domain-containing protein [Pirellulales bacterium]
MSRRKWIWLGGGWLACVLTAASSLAAEDATGDPSRAEKAAYFERHVRPLLVEHCYACHNAREGKPKGGLALDSLAGWTKGGDRGPAIVPGDPDASPLIQSVRYTDPDFRMPPERPLSPDAIAKLEHWVKQGAVDPRDGKESAAAAGASKPSDPIAGRSHWTFLPLNMAPPPIESASPVDRRWAAAPLDAYIAASRAEAKVAPVGDADRRTLARRAYFQLTGLPPTAEQADDFIRDDSPDAYERLVDRLLSSPHFGVQWGRHWLDLARYADSNGLDENFLFREAWRYRNWVLEAVSADMPYDRFLLEQLAGDLLPYSSIEERDRQRIAAGFLVIGPKVLLGNDPNERRMDVADEQLDTVGRVVLGQTLGCARCHDHKFDPIPTADYYALAGIFTSTQVMQTRFMLNEQRMMEQLIGLGADGERVNVEYERYYRELPQLREREKHARKAFELLEKADEKADDKAFTEHLEKHRDSVAPAAAEAAQPKDARVAAQREFLSSLEQQLKSPPPIPPRAMIPKDADKPANEAIRLAGKFNRLGDVVPRGFLRVASDSPPAIPEGQSGRLELARWLVDVEQGAGRVAARVLANRIWHHLLGRGLVRTVDNLGRTGETPSHPELLDHLARQLVERQWSVKSLVREIALSRTFQLDSRLDEASFAVDPENKLWWRSNRRRVMPEALRDAMLDAAGELHLARYDSTVSYLGDQATAVGDNKVRRRTDFPCRSVYLPVIRNDLPELFEVFDFANPHFATGLRPQTMAPTQGLFLLNDESVMAASQSLARRLIAGRLLAGRSEPDSTERSNTERSDGALVDELFERLFQSRPTEEERTAIEAFVQSTKKSWSEQGKADAELQAWTQVCHALFASSRFQILD